MKLAAAVAIVLVGVLVGTAVSLVRYYWIDAFDRRRK